MKPACILIVDDDHAQRSLLETFLRGHGFQTQCAASGEAAVQLLAERPFAMLISDVRMPGMSGLEALRHVRRSCPTLPVLLVTGFADIRGAVTAMRDGALNYLSKPIDLDELLSSVRHVLEPARRAAAGAPLPHPLPTGVIAESPLTRAVLRDAALVAPSDSRVLITGESGVGKELVVDLVHAWSRRAGGPLLKIDCTMPEAALEIELFGDTCGGPASRHAGRFEQAQGGTVLLNDVGQLSAALQGKLLRILIDGTFRAAGATDDLRTDARILAATNLDLEAEVAAGHLREDLFYRLSAVEIHVPPLRERPEDILPLATHFMGLLARRKSRFSASVADNLMRYPWPGNVRELRNAMERAALLSPGEIVLPEHLPPRILAATANLAAMPRGERRRLEEIEQEAILLSLRKHNYNRTETAAELAISRRALIYKLQRMRAEGLSIDPPPYEG